MNPNIKSLLDSSKSKDRSSLNEGYKQLKELESKALEYQRENTKYDSWNIPEPYVAEAREKFGTLGQLIVHGHDVFDRALEEFRTLIHLYAAQSKRHGECDWDQFTLRMNPNIKSLLDSSKSKDRSSLNEGYKQLKELESKALEYQRENTKYDSWNIPEPYVAEAREKFSTLGQLIVHGHDVFDRAIEEFRTLIHLYAAQSKRHGETVKTKLQKRASIEMVLNRVKDNTDTASRRWRFAEGDYRNLLDIEKKWVKETKRNEAAREMNLMSGRDATLDENRYKHLRNMIQKEGPKDTNAQKDLDDLLLTDRKYYTLHPEEKKDSVTPEIVRKQSLKERKPTGGPTRNPHRGTLQRTPSQTSLSSDEGDGGRKNPPPGDGKKIPVSMERLQEMEQREKLYLAKIEELTTRLSSFASKQLLDGNPNIADLSDPNRPTRLCEKFNCVYDNEWTEAFEELQGTGEKDEAILKMLMEIIIDVRVDKKSTSPDPKCFASISRNARDFQKASAKASVPSLCVMFKETYIKGACKLEYRKLTNLEHYVDKVVELVWLMVVQDPPMSICWQKEGEQMDKKTYKYYEKRGEMVRLTVWPAVLLYENGPLVSKGFIWPK
uniref:Mitochondria-eating protein C-terminal domain-containing protein n=1 Tax=Magallana gigas TaxID=29159 RepID=K1Q6Y3_MAGGI